MKQLYAPFAVKPRIPPEKHPHTSQPSPLEKDLMIRGDPVPTPISQHVQSPEEDSRGHDCQNGPKLTSGLVLLFLVNIQEKFPYQEPHGQPTMCFHSWSSSVFPQWVLLVRTEAGRTCLAIRGFGECNRISACVIKLTGWAWRSEKTFLPQARLEKNSHGDKCQC